MHVKNVSAMTEEDQLALALQMSLAGAEDDQQAMDTEEQVSLIANLIKIFHLLHSFTTCVCNTHSPFTHIG